MVIQQTDRQVDENIGYRAEYGSVFGVFSGGCDPSVPMLQPWDFEFCQFSVEERITGRQ
jgi:hypothetical protein